MLQFSFAEHHAPDGAPGFYIRFALRVLQFVLGVTVIGLYAVDLAAAAKVHVGADGRWVYAVFTGTLGAAASALFVLPRLKFFVLWPMDFIIFVFWIALFGLFGKIYIPDHPTPEQKGQWRMKHAVWVDFINALLWLVTAVYGAGVRWCIFKQNARGRATRLFGEDPMDTPLTMHLGRDKI